MIKIPCPKLRKEEIREALIIWLHEAGYRQDEIAWVFGKSRQTINGFVRKHKISTSNLTKN